MPKATYVVRFEAGSEQAANALASVLSETPGLEDAASSAFEAAPERWSVALHMAAPPDLGVIQQTLARQIGETRSAALRVETVDEQDWVAASLAGLPPVRAGRFVLHGSHDRGRAAPNAIAIEIEAALAFGTGHHGTTRGCLLALDALAKQSRRPHCVLDVGSGTGVLAIAAARAFRRPVLASDIDRQAVRVARANARANRAGAFVEFVHASGLTHQRFRRRAPFDLVFANILLPPLRRMAAALAAVVAPGGTLILSGLLPSHASAALSAYRAQGLQLWRRIVLEGWVTLVLRRGVAGGRGAP